MEWIIAAGFVALIILIAFLAVKDDRGRHVTRLSPLRDIPPEQRQREIDALLERYHSVYGE